MTKTIKLKIDHVVRDGDNIVFVVNPAHVPAGSVVEVEFDPEGAPPKDEESKTDGIERK